MNSIKIYRTAITVFLLLTFSSCRAQVSSGNTNTNEEETLIIGTWVAEGATINDKWVFTNNNTLKEYTDGILDISYTWSVSISINSGVRSVYLKIINKDDSSEKYTYEVSIVDDEKLILIYQRKNNMGIGKPATYLRQQV